MLQGEGGHSPASGGWIWPDKILNSIEDLLSAGNAVLLDFRFDVRYRGLVSSILRGRSECGRILILQNPMSGSPSEIDVPGMRVSFSNSLGGSPRLGEAADVNGRFLIRPTHSDVLSLLRGGEGTALLVHDSASGFLIEYGLRKAYRFFRGILDELESPGLFIWFSWAHDPTVNSIMRSLFNPVVSVYGGGVIISSP